MWYIVFNLIFAIWVLVDSRKRKANVLFWTIGTLLLGPIVLCVYFAKRPLKAGEVREGGRHGMYSKTLRSSGLY